MGSKLMAPCFGSGFFGMTEGWISGKGKLLCVFSLQWSAGSRRIWCSRNRRKNSSNCLGSETEEAFFGYGALLCPLLLGERRMREVASEARHAHILFF